MKTRTAPTFILAALFVASVAAANAATAHVGGPDHMIPIGIGLTATAGTLFAGCCLAIRDAIQDAGGRWAVLAGIALGAAVSVITSNPALAAASGIAFAVSELADSHYQACRPNHPTGEHLDGQHYPPTCGGTDPGQRPATPRPARPMGNQP